ncbi:hypothetical protein, partial [Xanthomonas euvesicatoria]
METLLKNCGGWRPGESVLHGLTPIKKPASADAGFSGSWALGGRRLVADPHRPRTIIRAQIV